MLKLKISSMLACKVYTPHSFFGNNIGAYYIIIINLLWCFCVWLFGVMIRENFAGWFACWLYTSLPGGILILCSCYYIHCGSPGSLSITFILLTFFLQTNTIIYNIMLYYISFIHFQTLQRYKNSKETYKREKRERTHTKKKE